MLTPRHSPGCSTNNLHPTFDHPGRVSPPAMRLVPGALQPHYRGASLAGSFLRGGGVSRPTPTLTQLFDFFFSCELRLYIAYLAATWILPLFCRS